MYVCIDICDDVYASVADTSYIYRHAMYCMYMYLTVHYYISHHLFFSLPFHFTSLTCQSTDSPVCRMWVRVVVATTLRWFIMALNMQTWLSSQKLSVCCSIVLIVLVVVVV